MTTKKISLNLQLQNNYLQYIKNISMYNRMLNAKDIDMTDHLTEDIVQHLCVASCHFLLSICTLNLMEVVGQMGFP